MPSGCASRSKAFGLEHAAQSATSVPPRSMRHAKLAPASPVNDSEGVLSLAGVVGDAVIDGAAGAAVSSV